MMGHFYFLTLRIPESQCRSMDRLVDHKLEVDRSNSLLPIELDVFRPSLAFDLDQYASCNREVVQLISALLRRDFPRKVRYLKKMRVNCLLLRPSLPPSLPWQNIMSPAALRPLPIPAINHSSKFHRTHRLIEIRHRDDHILVSKSPRFDIDSVTHFSLGALFALHLLLGRSKWMAIKGLR